MKPTGETKTADATINVAIVEDDVEVRRSLININNRETGMSCAGAFGTAQELSLIHISEPTRPY